MDLTNAQQNQKIKQKDNKPTDEAFIFYRPKKVKK